jgi:fatty acid desaturase
MKLFKTKRRKPLQLFITFSSLIAVAAINYTIIHSPVVLVMTMALFVHEFGHYFVAKSKGADPDYPYFIPLFPLTIGVTRIKNLKDKDRSQVAIAGMLFASLFLLTLISYNYLFNIFSVLALFIMLFIEIIFNTVGSDGKKYRKYKQYSF